MTGSLVCVGIGMTLGAHITPISKSHIEGADAVFILASNPFVEAWINTLSGNVCSLQTFYRQGQPRNQSYNEMVAAIIGEVANGKKVVAAFYGHPGVFACVAHRAIKKAQSLGFDAKMEAGISAEDCLYADLSIDPGKTGCTHFEASQFMLYQRRVDPSAYLILWQVSIAGEVSGSQFQGKLEYIRVLQELLFEIYPVDHEVILYEAKVLPIDVVRAERIKLADLVNATLNMQTTLVIPPCSAMIPNEKVRKRLERLDKILNNGHLTLIQ